MMMIRALLTTAVALAVTGLLALPAGAHTAMLRASPDRDTTAGGSIGFIDLEFLDPVANASVTVTYNGAPGDPSDDLIDYDPPSAWSGVDTFTYTIEDGNGGSVSIIAL